MYEVLGSLHQHNGEKARQKNKNDWYVISMNIKFYPYEIAPWQVIFHNGKLSLYKVLLNLGLQR